MPLGIAEINVQSGEPGPAPYNPHGREGKSLLSPPLIQKAYSQKMAGEAIL
jgi:hypothetical protein